MKRRLLARLFLYRCMCVWCLVLSLSFPLSCRKEEGEEEAWHCFGAFSWGPISRGGKSKSKPKLLCCFNAEHLLRCFPLAFVFASPPSRWLFD